MASVLGACGADDDEGVPQTETSSVSTAVAPLPPPTAAATKTAPPPTTTTTTMATTTSPTTPPEPTFAFTASEIGAELAARMEPTSWRPGCPVDLTDLRYLQLSYWGLDDASHLGELVVHADAVDVMQDVFATLFAERFPISSMRLVDDFGGDDFASIEADNTSAFNCRPTSGSSTNWSQHAYGRAIDINPLKNPYVSDGETEHPASVPYLDRDDVRPGMIVEGGVVVAAFDQHGWGWGGRWTDPVDTQHFSATGR